jgi:restriction system protein
LFRAGLLDRPKKGLYVITELGKKIAEQKPISIDRAFLMQFPQFVQFVQASGPKKSAEPDKQDASPVSESSVMGETPEELIDSSYQILNSTLRRELLDLVKKMDPFRFEQLVVDLLVAMGYGGSREEAAKVTKASGDEGIDGIINEDRLGLDVIYLQAKRWQQTVGRKEIQSFVGALAGQQAHKGVFITTSDFADTAIAYAKKVSQKVILIDGDKLAELMINHNIGVTLSHAYEVKHVDSDYFDQD